MARYCEIPEPKNYHNHPNPTPTPTPNRYPFTPDLLGLEGAAQLGVEDVGCRLPRVVRLGQG